MEQGTEKIRIASARDGQRIADRIESCYGKTYPVAGGTNPEAIACSIERGELFYALAERHGELVGQAALWRLNEHGLFECGRAVVAESHRGRGLFGTLARFLVEGVAPGAGARFVLGRGVTSHTYTQRYGQSSGAVTVGILLGYCRATIAPAGFGKAVEPVSIVLDARRIEAAPRPRALALVDEDRERAVAVLDGLGVRVVAPRRIPERLGVVVEHDPHFGVAHLRYGTGAPARSLDALEPEIAPSRARIAWADLPAEHPATPQLAAALREIGFGYCGYLPVAGPGGEDVLRLQRYQDATPLTAERLHVLASDRAFRDAILGEQRTLQEVS